MPNSWIVDVARTPIGRHRGALSGVRPDDLAATVLRTLVARAVPDPSVVDDVLLGCTNGVGEDSRNVARMAVLLAGLPDSVPGATVNRLCASGMEAVIGAHRGIQSRQGDIFIAGGVESMSRAPWAIAKPDRAQPWGDNVMADTTIGWRFVNPDMPPKHLASMGETAENVADAYAISREDQDAFAVRSHQRALAAHHAGRHAEEIVSITTPAGRDGTTTVTTDEGPRAGTTTETLARLPPAFRAGGSVTAGNSSSINDGAAALVLASDHGLETLGRPPLARVVTSAAVGVAPDMMGMGPVPAVRKALERAHLTLDDIDVVELNEAFASQSLACLRELHLDEERVNVNGGAIALGHPLGCSGARIVGTLAVELQRRDARYGLATMCVGVGQGVAVVLERA